MLSVGRARGLGARAAVVMLAGALVVAAVQQPALAKTPKPHGTGSIPSATGLAPVATPKVTPPTALPKHSGSVALVPKSLASGGVTAGRAGAASSAAVTPAATTTDKVALRALVIAVNASDYGLGALTTTLDRVGAAYDVFYSSTTALASDTLVGADGTGKYNAILLTDSLQIYASGSTYVSGFTPDEWNTLWSYEAAYGVRQAVLFASYGTWPEDYCLRSVSEGSVGDTPLNVSLTSTGAGIFDYLNPAVQIPVVQSYVYHTSIAAGCSADAVLTSGTDVLGVRSTSTDGRERLALTFSNNENLTQANLLVYGLVRWATKGMFLGQQQHYLNVDIDDWFNTVDHRYADGHIEATPGYTVSSAEAVNLAARQAALRTTYPLASAFELNLAFNGGDADLAAPAGCAADGTGTTFTRTSVCLSSQFRWLNHTYDHADLATTDYATTYADILNNRTVATALGISQPNDVLKTGSYSGLGVYTTIPGDTVNPPVDHGLAASNPNLLQAAKDLGVTYLHGSMSYASEVPACFNCGIVHPLNAAITVVPDWPTNIAYDVTTPDEETAFYNSLYGPTGTMPYWSTNQTYAQIVDDESNITLYHLTSGSINTNTFHIANVHDYGSGQTLLMDWANAVLTKYSAYYSVPLLNIDWSTLGHYTTARLGHFAERAAGASAVYDRSAGTITVTSPAAGSLQLTGAQTTNSSTYGTDVQATLALTAGTPVTVTAAPKL